MGNKSLTTEQFIINAKKVHGNKYDYSKTVYIKGALKVIITCPEHGDFLQQAAAHVHCAHNCPECGEIVSKKKMRRYYNNRKEDFSNIIPPIGSKVIPLTNGSYSIVDEEDYDRVIEVGWHKVRASAQNDMPIYYAKSRKGLLHRFILNVTDSNINIDHINRDTFDNRKCNLRPCTRDQNMMNSGPRLGSSSKYKGVCFVNPRKLWKATIGMNGKSYFLGEFTCETEAAICYDKKAKELFGEFAYLNFPDLKTGTDNL